MAAREDNSSNIVPLKYVALSSLLAYFKPEDIRSRFCKNYIEAATIHTKCLLAFIDCFVWPRGTFQSGSSPPHTSPLIFE